MRLHHDAHVPPEHLPGRHRHAGPGAAQAVRGQARARRSTSSSSSPRSCARSWPSSASARSTRWSAASTCSTRATAIEHWKAQGPRLHARSCTSPTCRPASPLHCIETQDHGLDERARQRADRAVHAGARARASRSSIELPIRNVEPHRRHDAVGARSRARYGAEGLPDDTIKLKLHAARPARASARSWRAGIDARARRRRQRLLRQGPVGRRASSSCRRRDATFVPEENIIVGNVALYGATGGEVFLRGMRRRALLRAQQRRDRGRRRRRRPRLRVHDRRHASSSSAGPGRNFAAGMSGGDRLRLDEDGSFATRCNHGHGRPRAARAEPTSIDACSR